MPARNDLPLNTWTRTPRTAEISPEYQAEIERSMGRGRLKWESEQAALARAERRRERLAKRKPKTAREAKITRHKLRELDAEIEMYRQHLIDVHRMMTATGTPSTSRGIKSFRPTSAPGEVL